MAGAFVSVDVIGDGQITKVLNDLIKQGTNLEGAFRDIGEHLIESTQQRMRDEVSPDGTPFEPLKQSTLDRKAANNQFLKILRADGHLADTLGYQASKNQLQFGSPLEYAATQQFGRDNANIPARPFLGVSSSDETEILDILRSHLNKAL